VEVHFVRSGGAGGQNVNKGAPRKRAARLFTPAHALPPRSVNTKADIRFLLSRADWLPTWVKQNLREQASRTKRTHACRLTRTRSATGSTRRASWSSTPLATGRRSKQQQCSAADQHQLNATRRQNYEDALEKLQTMIDAAAQPPTGPSDATIQKVKGLCVACAAALCSRLTANVCSAKRANQRRLEDKRRESSRKSDRRSKDYD